MDFLGLLLQPVRVSLYSLTWTSVRAVAKYLDGMYNIKHPSVIVSSDAKTGLPTCEIKLIHVVCPDVLTRSSGLQLPAS